MKNTRLASALFLLLTTSSSCMAAASAEEAARILASLQTYLGAEPGVVAVTPAGDGYDIAVDIMPYLKKNPEAGLVAKVDPFRMTVQPKGEGLWSVLSNAPIKAESSIPNKFSFSIDIPKVEWSGTYNENLFAFMEQKFSMSNMTVTSMNNDDSLKMNTTAVSVVEAISGSSTASDAGNGLVDGQSSVEFTNLVASNTVVAPPDTAQFMPNLNYTASNKKASYTSAVKGMASKPVMDLLAFFVAHPSRELLIKDQAVLKEKLLAALPIFASTQFSGAMNDVVYDTAYGKFGIANGAFTATINGAVKEGRVAEGFELNGLALPDSLPLPPWSKGLVPKSFKFGFDVSDFDADAPLRKFITEMDVAKDEPVPPGSEAAYVAAVAPKSTIKVTLPKGEIAADLFTLSFEGVSDINVSGALPTASGRIALKGLDAVIQQLQQAAADPTAQQAMAMLFAAKGFGKAEGDEMVWNISFDQTGKVLVNGTDMTSMMGAFGGTPAPAQ